MQPTLLTLYDTHYLALQGSLRPIMKAFILALLPGLEEETGEFFDQVRPPVYKNLRMVAEQSLGFNTARSSFRDGHTCILHSEYLALYAHHTLGPRTSVTIPLTKTSETQRRRRCA